MAKSEKRTLNISAILVDNISKELTGIRKSLNKTSKTIETQNKRSVAAFKKLGKAVKIVASAFIAFKAISAIKNIAATTDQIGKLAKATGDSASAISLLSAAFEFAGGKADDLKTVLSSLLASQKGALAGSKEQQFAFRRLGISMVALRDMTPARMLEQMAEGLGKIEDATQRTQTLAIMFPDQWRNVINLIEGGGKAFRGRLEEARKAGAEVTKEQVKAAALITDAYTKIDIATSALGRALMVTFAPTMIGALETLSKLIVNNKDEIAEFASVLGSVFVFALDQTANAIIGIVKLIESIPGVGSLYTSPGQEKVDRGEEMWQSGHGKLTALDNDPMSSLAMAGGGLNAQIILDPINATLDEAERLIREGKAQLAIELKAGLDPTMLLSEVMQNHKDNLVASIDQMKRDIAASNPVDWHGIGLTEDVVGPEGPWFFPTELEQAARDAATNVKSIWQEITGFIGGKLDAMGGSWERLSEGFESQFASLREGANDLSGALGKGLGKVVVGTFDAFSAGLAGIIDGTKSAKEAWQDFAKATLQMIAQLLAKMAALKIAQMIVGAEDGGVFPGVEHEGLPTTGFARGGIARSPQLAVFGEGNRNEAFVPLPDNRSIPVTFTGGQGAGGGQEVSVNIYAWDSKDAARGLMENRSVLQSIFTQQADNQVGMRQTLQRAVR